MQGDFVKIRVKYAVDVGFDAETPWATPLAASDAGGTYRLANNLVGTPLRDGDVVRCDLDGNSWHQVVAVEALVPGTLYSFTHPKETDAVVVPVVEALVAAGLDVNRPVDGIVQVLFGGSRGSRRGRALMNRVPPAWTEVERLDMQSRALQIAADVDFELDLSTLAPQEPVGYWAPDDPAWRERGIVDPDTLTTLQGLAASDPRILATIRANRHDDVLTYLERISTQDKRSLSPLGRPLLVDPDE
jgi:hypothetical protein